MGKINKLSLPAVILIASVIFGGFYYASQVSKQKSIEKQQQIKIEQERQDQLAKELKEQEVKAEVDKRAELNAFLLDDCLNTASKNYSANFKEACKTRDLKEDCSLPVMVANNLKDWLKDIQSNCFKQYPQN